MTDPKTTGSMPPVITIRSPEALLAGDMVTVGISPRKHRVQRGGDGATYLYPEWPGRNRHERRAAERIARHA